MARSSERLMIAFLFVLTLLGVSSGQQSAPSPGAAEESTSTSDGATIDQGIAYALLLCALAVTYILH